MLKHISGRLTDHDPRGNGMGAHALLTPSTAECSAVLRARGARRQRAIVASATLTGILGVTIASIAMVTIGLGA